MASEHADAQFQSALAPLMEQFIREKRACGYRYCEGARTLAGFDRFLLDSHPSFRLMCHWKRLAVAATWAANV